MKRQLPIYALAVAILVVGLAAVGVPVRIIVLPLALLACPLMMMFMMGGMHGGQEHDPEADAAKGADPQGDAPAGRSRGGKDS